MCTILSPYKYFDHFALTKTLLLIFFLAILHAKHNIKVSNFYLNYNRVDGEKKLLIQKIRKKMSIWCKI